MSRVSAAILVSGAYLIYGDLKISLDMDAKGFFKDLKGDVRDRKGLVNAGRFALVFLVSFLLFLYIIIPLAAGFWEGMGSVHAGLVHGLLSMAGVESSVSGNVLTMEVGGESVDFVISQLCSGDVEIALLASLLIASFDVLLIWRILGALLGAGVLLLLNPVRIAITLLITKEEGIDAGDFYHTLIFRLFLFVILVLYYFAWYRVFVGRKSKLQDKICKKVGIC
jgi:exosortase/archaeosortase family protein